MFDTKIEFPSDVIYADKEKTVFTVAFRGFLWSIRDYADQHYHAQDSEKNWILKLDSLSNAEDPLTEHGASMTQEQYNSWLDTQLQFSENVDPIFRLPIRDLNGVNKSPAEFFQIRPPHHPLESKRYSLLTPEQLKKALQFRKNKAKAKTWKYIWAPTWIKKFKHRFTGTAKTKMELIQCRSVQFA